MTTAPYLERTGWLRMRAAGWKKLRAEPKTADMLRSPDTLSEMVEAAHDPGTGRTQLARRNADHSWTLIVLDAQGAILGSSTAPTFIGARQPLLADRLLP